MLIFSGSYILDKKSVEIIRSAQAPYALMHCVSMYPTPYNKVRLGALADLHKNFPDAVIGISDHSVGNYTCFAAVALGASLVEKHFVSDKNWPGPDVPVSIDPAEFKQLITGTEAIYQASGGSKEILAEEQPIIDFAYACVVTIKDVKSGEEFTRENIWVKRPGTGEIKAVEYENILGRCATQDIPKDIRKDLTFKFVKELDEVLAIALRNGKI